MKQLWTPPTESSSSPPKLGITFNPTSELTPATEEVAVEIFPWQWDTLQQNPRFLTNYSLSQWDIPGLKRLLFRKCYKTQDL